MTCIISKRTACIDRIDFKHQIINCLIVGYIVAIQGYNADNLITWCEKNNEIYHWIFTISRFISSVITLIFVSFQNIIPTFGNKDLLIKPRSHVYMITFDEEIRRTVDRSIYLLKVDLFPICNSMINVKESGY